MPELSHACDSYIQAVHIEDTAIRLHEKGYFVCAEGVYGVGLMCQCPWTLPQVKVVMAGLTIRGVLSPETRGCKRDA